MTVPAALLPQTNQLRSYCGQPCCLSGHDSALAPIPERPIFGREES